jgi:hypothetical protein
MFGLQEIVALNNGSARIVPAATLELSTNAAALRAAVTARDSVHGSQPDANAEELRRQNAGGFCSGCGSTTGHFDFCYIVRGHRG